MRHPILLILNLLTFCSAGSIVVANLVLASDTSTAPRTYWDDAEDERERLTAAIGPPATANLDVIGRKRLDDYFFALCQTNHARDAAVLAGRRVAQANTASGTAASDYPTYLLQQANANLQCGDFEGAESCYRSVLAKDLEDNTADLSARLARDNNNLGIVYYLKGLSSAEPKDRSLKFDKARTYFALAEPGFASASPSDLLSCYENEAAAALAIKDRTQRLEAQRRADLVRAKLKVSVPLAN